MLKFIQIITRLVFSSSWVVAVSAAEAPIDLQQGWNLIGVPYELTDKNFESFQNELVSNGSSINSIWNYCGDCTTSGWQHYSPETGISNSGIFEAFQTRSGYWVNITETPSSNITFNGASATDSLILNDGWNLIGISSDNLETDIGSFLVNHKSLSIWSWSAERGWESYVSGVPSFLNSLQNLNLTKGYYLLVDNEAPVANNMTITATEDSVAQSSFDANDPDGDSLTFTVLNSPSHGRVDISSSGTFTYTPIQDYDGSDSFTYRANDPVARSQVKTVNVTITALPDSPVLSETSITLNAEDGAVAHQFTASDADNGDVLTYSVTRQPAQGSASIDSSTGTLVFTPNSTATGSDSLEITVSDDSGLTASTTIIVTLGYQYGIWDKLFSTYNNVKWNPPSPNTLYWDQAKFE